MSRKFRESIQSSIVTVLTSFVVAVGINMVIQLTNVSGSSMYPTLEDKDYLILNKLAYKFGEPKRGDIVVFDSELVDEATGKQKKLIKRVIGLPGDKIEIVNGYVYINDTLLEETYLDGVFTDGDVNMVVPAGEYYVMGDNRPHSGDSRSSLVGTVSIDDMVGKLLIRVYPFNKMGEVD